MISLFLYHWNPYCAWVTEVWSSDHPVGVAVTPNGSYVYVTNYHSDTVSVVQTSDNTVVDIISVGDFPRGVAVIPNGRYVYVANGFDNTMSVIGFSG